MKIYKVELIIVEPQDNYGIESELETMKNSVGSIIHVVSIETKDDKKEWDDNHPLNYSVTRAKNYFNKLTP